MYESDDEQSKTEFYYRETNNNKNNNKNKNNNIENDLWKMTILCDAIRM